jgi:hypothetical protein
VREQAMGDRFGVEALREIAGACNDGNHMI